MNTENSNDTGLLRRFFKSILSTEGATVSSNQIYRVALVAVLVAMIYGSNANHSSLSSRIDQTNVRIDETNIRIDTTNAMVGENHRLLIQLVNSNAELKAILLEKLEELKEENRAKNEQQDERLGEIEKMLEEFIALQNKPEQE